MRVDGFVSKVFCTGFSVDAVGAVDVLERGGAVFEVEVKEGFKYFQSHLA